MRRVLRFFWKCLKSAFVFLLGVELLSGDWIRTWTVDILSLKRFVLSIPHTFRCYWQMCNYGSIDFRVHESLGCFSDLFSAKLRILAC